MQISKESEDKYQTVIDSLNEVNSEYEANFGKFTTTPINKVDYETLIEAEKSILKLNRLMNRSLKFYNRKYVDPENHQRREARMRQRAIERSNSYLVSDFKINEDQLQYEDYFETDLEKYPDNEAIEELYDHIHLQQSGRYDTDKFDFQERYTHAPVEDATKYIEKKIWKFKFRHFSTKFNDFERKEARMLDR